MYIHGLAQDNKNLAIQNWPFQNVNDWRLSHSLWGHLNNQYNLLCTLFFSIRATNDKTLYGGGDHWLSVPFFVCFVKAKFAIATAVKWFYHVVSKRLEYSCSLINSIVPIQFSKSLHLIRCSINGKRFSCFAFLFYQTSWFGTPFFKWT